MSESVPLREQRKQLAQSLQTWIEFKDSDLHAALQATFKYDIASDEQKSRGCKESHDIVYNQGHKDMAYDAYNRVTQIIENLKKQISDLDRQLEQQEAKEAGIGPY